MPKPGKSGRNIEMLTDKVNEQAANAKAPVQAEEGITPASLKDLILSTIRSEFVLQCPFHITSPKELRY